MAKQAAVALCLLFALFCLAMIAYFYFFTPFPPVEENIRETFSDIHTLHVANDDGLIQIVAGDSPELEVDLTKVAGPRLPYFSDSLLDKARIHTTVTDGRLDVSVVALPSWRGAVRVEIQIVAPPETAVAVQSAGGNVTVIGMRGTVDVQQTGHSAVVLQNNLGPLAASAERGELRCECRGGDGPIALTLGRGKILMSLPTATPPPIRLSLEDGQVLVMILPETGADLIYRTSGRYFNQLVVPAILEQSGGEPVGMRLGEGGRTLEVDAGEGEFTLMWLTPPAKPDA